MSGPLSGLRVLDLTSVVLGPLATQTLGDMGADIVKIEGPAGDTTRYTGPKRSKDMSALYMGLNRNKRSIVLDLKQHSAKDVLWRLIDGADVFLHSIRPQAIGRLGFGHDNVLARNPRMVYAGVHGFRMDGPYYGRPAYDDVIQGLSGSADLMARLVDEPRYMPTIMADKTCGLVTVNAILAALYEREQSGEGQFVEIPMLETMVAFNMADHIFGHAFEPPEGPMGYSRVLTPSRRPYKTLDGYICLLAYTDPQWERFWAEVGVPELKDDPRFDSLASRADNIEAVYSLAGEYIATRNTAEWLEVLPRLEIPCGEIVELESLPDDPHLQAIEFFRSEDHPTEGKITIPDIAVQFGRTPGSIDRLQPKLGEHSIEILREAGYSDADIEDLQAAGATI
ncbi:MAG TPA: CoA transferase [Rhodospirillaceae bacterium]|nr:CoA transferase [Rhodospirillaceae bacterium]|tara:strand:- start:21195 stop:22382 length:1188 start_codon:yes stop_codon:yes gene_type:complete